MQPHETLEKEFAQCLGLNPDCCVACSSGTAALHLALESLQLPACSKIVCPDFTMIACPRAISLAGHTPVFVDCMDNLDMSCEQTAYALSKYHNSVPPSAVMAVHIYGRESEIPDFMQAAGYDTPVIEDLAECHGLAPHPNSAAAAWCLPKTSTVVLSNGLREEIRYIKVGDRILSASQEKKLEFVTVTAKRETAAQPLLKIEYESGGQISCSYGHKILVERSGLEVWLEASDLRIGDRILHKTMAPAETENQDNLDMCYMAGLVASDGSINRKYVVSFCNRDDGLRQIWLELCARLFNKTPSEFHIKNDSSRLCSEQARKRLDHLERNIGSYSEQCIAAYIRGFADGDGCIFESGNGRPHINLATLGNKEPEHLRHLLLRLGIRSQFSKVLPKIRKFPNGTTSNTVGGRCVVITNPLHVLSFLELVGFSHPKKHAKAEEWKKRLLIANLRYDRLDTHQVGQTLLLARRRARISSGTMHSINAAALSLAERGKSRLSRDTIRDVAEELNSAELKKIVDKEVYYWKVLKITEEESRDTLIDISVSKNDCFFADGVLVHNSFYRNKVIAGEEGGMVFLRDIERAKLARSLRCQGFTDAHDFTHIPRGHNYRLAPSLADLILTSLHQFKSNLGKRRAIEAFYDEHCPTEWKMPPRDCPWVYDLRIPNCHIGSPIDSLREAGIEARHSFKPCSLQDEYVKCRRVGDAHNAEKAAVEVIYLPIQPDVTTVTSILHAFDILRTMLL